MVAGEAALQESSERWCHLASGFEADISQQPALLKGGELRDYQMKVTGHTTHPTPWHALCMFSWSAS